MASGAIWRLGLVTTAIISSVSALSAASAPTRPRIPRPWTQPCLLEVETTRKLYERWDEDRYTQLVHLDMSKYEPGWSDGLGSGGGGRKGLMEVLVEAEKRRKALPHRVEEFRAGEVPPGLLVSSA